MVSGTCLRGTIRLNDTLLLGPDPLGQFQPIQVKTIHRKRMPVRELRAGQTASFALKKVCSVFTITCKFTTEVTQERIGSLSSNVFERCTSTGSGLFSNFDGGFAQIFSQIASITVKKLRNTNFISSRHVKRENTSLPVDVRRSKTSLLKLPNDLE